MANTCDPFWSEQNQGCSDEFGNYVDASGKSIQSWDLSRLLQGIQAAITPKAATPPAAGAKPAADPTKKQEPFDLEVWLKKDNHGIYVLVVVSFVFIMLLTARRR